MKTLGALRMTLGGNAIRYTIRLIVSDGFQLCEIIMNKSKVTT